MKNKKVYIILFILIFIVLYVINCFHKIDCISCLIGEGVLFLFAMVRLYWD